jgi:hypothetical protein
LEVKTRQQSFSLDTAFRRLTEQFCRTEGIRRLRARLHLFSFRFGRVVGTKKNVSYEYMFGVTPLAIFRANEVVNEDFVSPTETPLVAPTKRETSYGIGFSRLILSLCSSPKTV